MHAVRATGRRTCIALIATLAVALGLPALASASSAAASLGFTVPASNGYQLDVTTDGDHVGILVSGRVAFVEYEVPATTKHGVVEAHFGGLGSIAMKFIPAGPPRRSVEPNGCHGRRPTYQKGHLVGDFRFRGEGGYAVATSHRAAGYAERGFTGLCGGAGGHPEVPNLVAHARSGHRAVTVSTYFREYEVATHAEVTERIGAMNIWRAVGLAGPLGVASLGSDGSVLVSPPSPFSGSAGYLPHSSGARWAGNLTAAFPGLGPVRLAGPRFKVSVRSPLPSSLSGP